MTLRLIHDVDTAQDDAFALLIGMRHPNSNVEAVTVNYGNVNFDQMVENTLYTIEVAGFGGKIPVYEGCRLPLIAPFDDSSYVHGVDGFGGANFPKAKQRPESENAVAALIRLINENPGEFTIIAQAPLTNLACAVAADRSIAGKVKDLFIMGGTNNAVGNVTAAAEANFWHDPEAAKIVLNAGFPVTLVTWDLTMTQGRFNEAQLRQIDALDTPQSRFFTKANRASVEYVKKTHGVEGSTHPDSIAAAIAVEPAIVKKATDYYVDIETHGSIAQGYMLVDAVRRSGHEPNARVVEEIDQELFFQTMLKVLS
ncbi:nucleoside hydrolase [Georgenia thermotolerans]|uniref:Nucleoside hydrolase n=1 Tax=Georgenia thermotolerans TaxID=527326 RepID=A0A7J5UTJ9_9MICO|nr:nucleoside hydrolase [Georgenia thermotolerans]KAE8765602.1 nucleoside hydrolase [Georgenia thermotolerans]